MILFRPRRRRSSEPRKTLKQEIIELLQSKNSFYEVKFDAGRGKEEYDGCKQNLIEILESPESKCRRMTVKSDQVKRFRVSVQSLGWVIYFEFAV